MAVILLAMGFAQSAFACPTDSQIRFISCREPVVTEILALDQGALAPVPDPSQIIVTGTYSSADRYGIEGLAIINGVLVSRRFQGWDGLLVATQDGSAAIHFVENVIIGSDRFNLRDPDQRQAFIAYATDHGLSVIQSHLLVTDGVVDVRDVPGQPRFRRRMLFVTTDGDFGLFETDDSLSLFDAATLVQQSTSAQMVFNLDMGAYDYCTIGPDECGWLGRKDTGILTNILRFSF